MPSPQLPEAVVGEESRDAVVQDPQRSKEEEQPSNLIKGALETSNTATLTEAKEEYDMDLETGEQAKQADGENDDQRAEDSPGELDQENQDTQLVQEELVADFQEGKKRVKVSATFYECRTFMSTTDRFRI